MWSRHPDSPGSVPVTHRFTNLDNSLKRWGTAPAVPWQGSSFLDGDSDSAVDQLTEAMEQGLFSGYSHPQGRDMIFNMLADAGVICIVWW